MSSEFVGCIPAGLGEQLLDANNDAFIGLALRILDGFDDRQIPRRTPLVMKRPDTLAVIAGSTKHDAKIEEQQRQWLAKTEKR